MRKRRKQFHAFDHPLFLVIVEPVLTRLEAGNDRMSCRRRMFGRMLARRTIAASDVSALRTSAKMKPPTFRGRQTFHTPVATRFRSGIDSAQTFFHSRFSFPVPCSQIISRHQQDFPDAALLCGCLGFGRFAKWHFLANRDYQLAIAHRFGHELEGFPVEL
jgi:hypothetical protein